MRRFEAVVASERPDIVHFQWLPLPIVDLPSLRRLHRAVPLVLTLHDTSLYHGSPSSFLQGLGLRRAVRQFDHIVVHTAYSRERLLASGWTTADRVSVIRHGALGFYRDRVRVTAPRTDGRVMILFFGSLKPYKGLDTLIRAVARLGLEEISRCEVRIAGQAGMDLGSLRALASELGVGPYIEWETGFVSEERVAELFQQADIVALPYREIDQSGVLLTAAAFGKAVVATSIGGIPEVIRDGESGLLTPPDDAPALARALRTSIADPGLRLRLGTALRHTAETEHSWAAAASATRSLYASLSAAPRMQRP
jgi:glycosyltransferase involved in cell wall biosynthesis